MFSPYHWHEHKIKVGLRYVNLMWWKYVPGITVKVKWPVGLIAPDYKIESADPNDHYRPWLEEHVGRQGWDWDWSLNDTDVADNLLTIKLLKKHESCATLIALKWS